MLLVWLVWTPIYVILVSLATVLAAITLFILNLVLDLDTDTGAVILSYLGALFTATLHLGVGAVVWLVVHSYRLQGTAGVGGRTNADGHVP